MRRLVLRVLPCFLGGMVLLWGVQGHARETSEYQVKAILLVKLLRHVQWEEREVGRTLVIGIVGDDPFGEFLDPEQAEEQLGQPLQVRRFERLEEGVDVSDCDLLFVGASEKRRMERILEEVAGTGVVTVADSPGFLEEGGVINFVIVDRKVRFEINQRAARDQGVRIHTSVLAHATRVIRK